MSLKFWKAEQLLKLQLHFSWREEEVLEDQQQV